MVVERVPGRSGQPRLMHTGADDFLQADSGANPAQVIRQVHRNDVMNVRRLP